MFGQNLNLVFGQQECKEEGEVVYQEWCKGVTPGVEYPRRGTPGFFRRNPWGGSVSGHNF